MVGGVGDVEAVGRGAIGEEVVGTPPSSRRNGVLRAAHGELDVVGEQALQQLLGLRPARLDLAHVRDVEDTARVAHGHVLLTDPAVLHGHLPAREGHELGPRVHVAVEQGRALERLGRGGGGHRARTLATRPVCAGAVRAPVRALRTSCPECAWSGRPGPADHGGAGHARPRWTRRAPRGAGPDRQWSSQARRFPRG